VSRQSDPLDTHRVEERQQVVLEIEPGRARPVGSQCRRSVTAVVGRDDAQIGRQRREDGAIGAGVEAVGVQEHQVGRAIGRSVVEIGDLAGPCRRADAHGAGAGLMGDIGIQIGDSGFVVDGRLLGWARKVSLPHLHWGARP
jgi:hypothetical protein